jgi:anti-sigma regulatory factor (Ser/Thr protein kinase)
MSEALWAHQARPAPGPRASSVGRWEPACGAELTTHRRQLAAALRAGGTPSGNDDDAVDELLLAFEELASNALRHGGGQVRATVTDTGGSWLLDVSDAGVDRPPTPAIGRDAAEGGLGLYLIAQMCSAHGWMVDEERKHVWACVDHTPTEETARACGAGSPVSRR